MSSPKPHRSFRTLFTSSGLLSPRVSLLDGPVLPAGGPPSTLREGMLNLSLAVFIWLLLGEASSYLTGATTGSSSLHFFITTRFTLHLMVEGLASLLALGVLWLLCAWASVGYFFPYSSWVSHAAQAVGVLSLLLAVPAAVHCCTPQWPLLQRLALCMVAVVMGLKLWALAEANRQLQAEVQEGRGDGAGEYVRAVLQQASSAGKAAAFEGTAQDGTRWTLAREPWPARITLHAFLRHLFSPQLVYFPNAPTTAAIRPRYLAEKLLLLLAVVTCAVLTQEKLLLPVWSRTAQLKGGAAMQASLFLELFFASVIPCVLLCGCLFLSTFECITNIVSECMLCADRPFYSGWWTSTSFEGFSRTWNLPVGDFLRRHVYEPGGSTTTALCKTLLFSVISHELCIWAAMGSRWRFPWLGALSLMQLPLLPLLRLIPATAAGNVLFWLLLSGGIGLICLLYAMDLHRDA